MPRWAQWAAEVNPVKHFAVILRAVLVKGAGWEVVARPILILAVGGVGILTLAVRKYSKQAH